MEELEPAPPRYTPPFVPKPKPVGGIMKKWILGTSWRTTLFGYLVAAGQLAYDSWQSGGMTIKGSIVSALIVIAGRIVKDVSSTGVGANAVNIAPGTAMMVGEETAREPIGVPGPAGPEGPEGIQGEPGPRGAKGRVGNR